MSSSLIVVPFSANADSRVLSNPVSEWGWDYIDGMVDGNFLSKYDGSGVDIFVIDSGVDSSASNIKLAGLKDFTLDVGTSNENKACLMHGNMVSSIIAGESFGVASKASVYSAKVFTCGSTGGSSDSVVKALEWVDEVRTEGKPTVVNMSFRSDYHSSYLPIINKLADSGVIMVAAAGNVNQDACSYSPVGLPNTIGVGALSNKFEKADYSNYGDCVDFWAPGSELLVKCSAKAGYVCYASGTSLATPFVSSVIALFLQNNPKASYEDVMEWLSSNAKIVDGLKHVQLSEAYVDNYDILNKERVVAQSGKEKFTVKVVGRTITVNAYGLTRGVSYSVDLSHDDSHSVVTKTISRGKASFRVSKNGVYNIALWHSPYGKSVLSKYEIVKVVVKR